MPTLWMRLPLLPRWNRPIAFLLAFGLFLVPGVARAHNRLVSSVPAKDATLTTAPRELRLKFTETVELAVSSLTLEGPRGTKVALGALTQPADSGTFIVASIASGLANGKYTLKWRATGKDGHAVRGTFQFMLAIPPAPKRPLDTEAPFDAPFDASSPLYAAVRWARYVGLLTLVGSAAFVLGVLPRIRPDAGFDIAVLRRESAARARTIAHLGALTLLASSALRLVAQVVSVGDVEALRDGAVIASVISHTTWGHAWLFEVGATLIALSAIGVRPRVMHWGGVALAAPLLALASALSGHAAALSARAPLAVALDATHVLSASGWIGGLFSVVVAGLSAARALGRDASELATRSLIIAFSPTALTWAGLLVISGTLMAWMHVGTFGALANSTYGRTLLVKLSVVASVAATGALNWRRVLPALGGPDGSTRLRRSATTELILAAVVIAVTAVLVATPTPVETGM